jgi:hypothetical protein
MNEITLPDGTTRRLGNIVPTKAIDQSQYVVYGDTPNTPLILRSKWDELLADWDTDFGHPFLPPIHDQNGVGQCNADATTMAMELRRAIQGLDYVQLSAADLYARINGGRDQGSLLEDGLREATANGVGTAATSGTLWKNGVWKGPASAEERKQYRAEAVLCPTFEHVISANNPDADGWLPNPRGNAGGHAIMGFRPRKRGNTFGIVHAQSWGQWSPRTKNCFVVPETAFDNAIGGWWAIVGMTDKGV